MHPQRAAARRACRQPRASAAVLVDRPRHTCVAGARGAGSEVIDWPEADFVQQAAAQLPWFDLCTLIDKLKTREDRDWYLAKAI